MSENREIEIRRYCQSWFWQDKEKSELLIKLLKRIYKLEDEIKKNMQRQSIIVLLNYTDEPITRGNLKKLCEEFNFPYHTLCRLKFPILYKDFIIHKTPFK